MCLIVSVLIYDKFVINCICFFEPLKMRVKSFEIDEVFRWGGLPLFSFPKSIKFSSLQRHIPENENHHRAISNQIRRADLFYHT